MERKEITEREDVDLSFFLLCRFFSLKYSTSAFQPTFIVKDPLREQIHLPLSREDADELRRRTVST